MNTYIWMIRREIWERRAIWMLPAVVGGLVILAALFGRADVMTLDSPLEGRAFGRAFLSAFVVLFFAVMSLYSTLYLLDCLYDDRRDRSILFWKSLPISDTKTVLSKLAVALLVVPLVCFAIADVTALLTAFIVSVRARSLIGSALWQGSLWFQVQVLWVYVIVTSGVWFLPIAGWLLLVSAWAKRAVMMWAVLPPLALYFVERWFFGTHIIATTLGKRLLGYPEAAFSIDHASEQWVNPLADDSATQVPVSVWHALNISGLLSNPQTWIGLIVGVALIVGAIQLRLRRTEV